jgi:hypothetical protein
MMISPLKTGDTVPHPRVASVEMPWLETIRFQKCVHMQDSLCKLYGALSD